MARLKGKVALITGGGSGIGRATALLFADEGAKLVIADCVSEGAEGVVRMVRSAGCQAGFIKADVSKSSDVQKMIKTAIDSYGRLDILFNNAGVEQPLAATADTSEELWDRVININLKGVFLGMKYAIPEMLKGGGGVIVNTASINSFVAISHQPAYNSSKGGVLMLTRTAALEYVKDNIRINCVCPGPVDTPLLGRTRDSDLWRELAPTRIKPPMGRPATAEDIARAVLYLASDDSSYCTGTALVVDGGFTAL